MASFCSTAAQEKLLGFNNEINTLQLVVGGDRAPFGKDEIACYLSRSKHVLSSNGNFLIFAANS